MKIYEPGSKALSKDEYERRIELLRPKIVNAHFKMRKGNSPVIVVISGVEGAGKGEVIHALNEWLDPRGTETHSFWLPTEDERRRPHYWRFNQAMPGRGRVGILFGSWYTDPIIQRVEGLKHKDFHAQLQSICNFEEMLALDGAVFLKLWFHISKKVMKERMDDIDRHPELHWHMLPVRKKMLATYEKYHEISSEALNETDGALAEWHFVDSSCDRFRNLTAANLILQALETAGKSAKPHVPKAKHLATSIPNVVSRLGSVNLNKKIPDNEYDELLPKYQSRLTRLAWRMFKRRKSLLAVFEGWDAAGKGGAIRRVTQSLDPRLYQVVGFSAPNDEEKAHHYLWRFWRTLPVSGQTTIFDRSHYGRVLVERVEGYARVDEWARAYDEINEFEKHIAQGGYAIAKFWLQISQEEQLKRFKERERVSFKQYKITPEDWRNRDKWPRYEEAVEEMLLRTDTDVAPWTVVPATDKRTARITVLKTLCRTLEDFLDRE